MGQFAGLFIVAAIFYYLGRYDKEKLLKFQSEHIRILEERINRRDLIIEEMENDNSYNEHGSK